MDNLNNIEIWNSSGEQSEAFCKLLKPLWAEKKEM